jgi:cobaltochelatase CobS
MQRLKTDWQSVAAAASEKTSQLIASATQEAITGVLEQFASERFTIQDLVSSDEFRDAVRDCATVTRTVEVVRPSGVKHTEDVVHENFEHLLKMVGAGMNVALVGEAGSGKTHAAEQCARALGVEYYPMSFHAKMTSTDLRGYMDAKGDYNESAMYRAFKLGGLLCLDEFDRSNTEVVVSLNNLLAGASYLFPNNELVKKHEDFRVVACQNTTGSGGSKQYAAAQRQDASTLNRFVTIPWDIDNAMERKIAGDTPITTIVQTIRDKAKELGMDVVISPRQSIYANTLVSMGYSTTQAIDYAITGMMANDVRKRLVGDISEISNIKFAKK